MIAEEVFLSEVIDEYTRERGLPPICKGIEDPLDILGKLTIVRPTVSGLELRSYAGEPRIEWDGEPSKLRLFIYDIYYLNPGQETGPITTEKAARLALCLNKLLGYYLEKVRPPEDPLKALEELSSRVHVKEREEIIYRIYQVIERKFTIIYLNGDLLCFNGRIYEECRGKIIREIEALASTYNLAPKTSRFITNEVLAKLERAHYTEPHEIARSHFTLAYQNGLLDVKEFVEKGIIELRPFSPEVYVEHEIPHKIDASVSKLVMREYGLEAYSDTLIDVVDLAEKVTPYYSKVFSSWVDGKDNLALLYEIIGYTLYKAYPIHRAFMLVGEGGNGKSTYLGLIRRILGPQNVVSISLQALADPSNRFAESRLYKKLANIYPDIPKKPLRDTGLFKALTGEDPITADRKFRDPITFVNYAKLLFSANVLPEVDDSTFAFWRRWTLVEFPYKFTHNETFKRELYTHAELPKLIAVSLYALRNVLKRMSFSAEAEVREKWFRRVSSVYAFIQDLLAGKIDGVVAERDPEAKVETTKLYELYTKYCYEEDLEPKPKNVFTQELERQGFRKVTIRGKRYYKGLRVEIDNPNGLF